MGHVIITTAILVVCFLVNADFVGKTCSQHHWNIVVSIYFWFCLQSKVSRKGRWYLPRMFFVAFVQFVSKLFFPKMYWDFNGWACNPAGGPQDPQGCNYCNYLARCWFRREKACVVIWSSPSWVYISVRGGPLSCESFSQWQRHRQVVVGFALWWRAGWQSRRKTQNTDPDGSD